MVERAVETAHAGLVAQLRAAGERYYGGDQNDSYTGSGHPFFYVSVPVLRRMARTWLAAHRRDADAHLLAVTDALFRGKAYEEKVLAAVLLQSNVRIWRQVTPAMV